MNLYYFGFLLAFTIGFCSCHERIQESKSSIQDYRHLPPPPLSLEDQRLCDSMRALGYVFLQKGRVILFGRDTLQDNVRRLHFRNALKKEFKMEYQEVFNHDFGLTRAFRICVQPIMDSVIEVRYGIHGKDSIINVLYQVIDGNPR